MIDGFVKLLLRSLPSSVAAEAEGTKGVAWLVARFSPAPRGLAAYEPIRGARRRVWVRLGMVEMGRGELARAAQVREISK